MDFIIKKASALSQEEQVSRGISGIPQDWPIEKYPYIDSVPDGFEQISEENLSILIGNNQAAYDAWLQALRPIVNNPPTGPLSVRLEDNSVVTTQFELNNKDLKLAKAVGILDGNTNLVEMAVRIPGEFGDGGGRYVAGGYAISNDYNVDDYVTVHVEDKDRCIAMAIALSMDPEATEPVSDETVRNMGEIPEIGKFPMYPIVKSYTDDELPPENQGWFFWPIAGSLHGECEVEPIGGYGFIPSGFYLLLKYIRPEEVKTGECRINIYWGKLE